MSKRTCPNGHTTKDKTATHCPQCGEMLPDPIKPNRKRLLLIIGGLLFLCVIVAIATQGTGSNGTKSAESTDAPVAAGSTRPSRTPRPTNTPVPTRTPVPTKTPMPTATPKPITELPYEEIQAKREAMTDAQWEQYSGGLKGLVVSWSGWVEDVKEKGSAAQILVDMDNPQEIMSVQECYVPIPKDAMLGYNLDDPISWVGEISSVSDFMGLVSVTFGSAEISE